MKLLNVKLSFNGLMILSSSADFIDNTFNCSRVKLLTFIGNIHVQKVLRYLTLIIAISYCNIFISHVTQESYFLETYEEGIRKVRTALF